MKDLENLKKLIKLGEYDWDAATEDAAEKILNNPEALLWR